MRVLVCPADTSAGLNVVLSLRRCPGIHVYGLLGSPRHAVRAFCDRIAVAPTVHERVCRVERACWSADVDVVLPGHSSDLVALAAAARSDRRVERRVLMPSPSALSVCSDKLALHDSLMRHGLPVVPTWSAEDIPSDAAFPLFLKARCGTGSRHAQTVVDRRQLQAAIRAVGDEELVIQPSVEGMEVTVDYLASRTCRLMTWVPRARLVVSGGKTVVGRTLPAASFGSLMERLTSSLALCGPGNVQLFLVDGETVVFDVNPRFAAGGLMLSTTAGVNLPLLTARTVMGLPTTISTGVSELEMYRYETEVFVRPGRRACEP